MTSIAPEPGHGKGSAPLVARLTVLFLRTRRRSRYGTRHLGMTGLTCERLLISCIDLMRIVRKRRGYAPLHFLFFRRLRQPMAGTTVRHLRRLQLFVTPSAETMTRCEPTGR